MTAVKLSMLMPEVLFVKMIGFILLYNGLVFTSLAKVAAALPLLVSLCCIPMEEGGATGMGKLLNINYHQHAPQKAIAIVYDHIKLYDFPIEAANLRFAYS
ncbi:hypothetical protein BO71DRAFT_426968 [Aspergillus ellipticus CBS 707.79]|uniref:Uncharacterized protein n=1 Tax=Aspergillus ellipticus CBS 707.79 TaxID=1448320 RepID=A0A319DU44_9EURO|nr:hypothetical protein BO71DRAFT_426968 [Aspergillus ellipticus CBS 707.79]